MTQCWCQLCKNRRYFLLVIQEPGLYRMWGSV